MSAWTARSIRLLERVQDLVTVAVGVVLLGVAIVLLVSGVADFVDGSTGPVSKGVPVLLDHVLLVLIIVEIVYTVVLTLRSHQLVAQPFIIIGLIAVIRRILFVLTPRNGGPGNTELALLIAMVAVFVTAQIAIGYFSRND
jgi:uncharacterized membrane protein (DUF373 family)